MKNDIVKNLIGIVLIATAAGIAYKLYKLSKQGTKENMKAPFVFGLLPYPITSDVVSSPFGAVRPSGPHNGVDLKTKFDAAGKPDPRGTPDIGMTIFAPFPGIVADVYTNARGGLQMILLAKDGTKLGLAHLLTAQVKKGETFEAGDIVAGSGNSGPPNTPPHVHVTVRDPTGTSVDPLPYLGV